MVSLEQLLATVQGVRDIPAATRKALHRERSEVYSGAVKQEKTMSKTLTGIMKRYKAGEIGEETAMKEATDAADRHQAFLTDIALRRVRKVLHKDISTVAPEVTERLTTMKNMTLTHFKRALADAEKAEE